MSPMGAGGGGGRAEVLQTPERQTRARKVARD